MTLADLAANPAVFATLGPEEQRHLYRDVLVLEAELRAVLMCSLSSPKTLTLQPRAVTPLRFSEAAAVLGLSQSFVRRRWREFPQWAGYEDIDGVVRFPRAALEQNATNLDGRRPRPRRV